MTGEPGPAKDFIADDFVGITSKGARYEKPRALQDIVDSKGKYKSMIVGDVTVRVYGEAAVARGTDTWEMADALNRRLHDTLSTGGPTAHAARGTNWGSGTSSSVAATTPPST